jgi:hypothetical protein
MIVFRPSADPNRRYPSAKPGDSHALRKKFPQTLHPRSFVPENRTGNQKTSRATDSKEQSKPPATPRQALLMVWALNAQLLKQREQNSRRNNEHHSEGTSVGARFSERFRGVPGHPFQTGFDLTLRPERLNEPHDWKRPRMIFVNSMSDLFHKDIPKAHIIAVFDTTEKAD